MNLYEPTPSSVPTLQGPWPYRLAKRKAEKLASRMDYSTRAIPWLVAVGVCAWVIWRVGL